MMKADIDVTPMVGVSLVLLMLLMTVGPSCGDGTGVLLPSSTTAERVRDTENQLAITVKYDATLFVGRMAIRRDQLASELARIHAQTPDRDVAVRGDARVAYGAVADVLAACRAAGFANMALITTRRESATAASQR